MSVHALSKFVIFVSTLGTATPIMPYIFDVVRTMESTYFYYLDF